MAVSTKAQVQRRSAMGVAVTLLFFLMAEEVSSSAHNPAARPVHTDLAEGIIYSCRATGATIPVWAVAFCSLFS